jgi:hypothetical protein
MRRMHDVDLLLNGSIDMHLHHGPAPRLPESTPLRRPAKRNKPV